MTGTLLGVWAHPDDETYLSGGLMAAARARGDRVVVVTATLGEQGTPDPDRWPAHRLGELRRHEMRAALAALGVYEHYFLGVPDGGCDAVDLAPAIAAVIDDVRPDTIVTFGPDGMTGHRDHRAVSAWTTAAWHYGGRAARLWYATLTPEFHREHSATNDALGIWMDSDDPPCVEQSDLAHAVDLEGAALDQKLAALRAHASQTEPLQRALGEDAYRSWWRTESFVDAAAYDASPVLHPVGAAR